ncbi:MAG: hypothetical protein ACOYK7_07420 [Pirellulales bacterium]
MADGRHADAKGGAVRAEARTENRRAVEGDPGAVITFHCPNGHRINVSARLAGKRGACSKCGVDVVIPAATPVVAEPPPAPPARPPQAPPPAPVVVAVPPPVSPPASQAVGTGFQKPDDSTDLDALFDAVGGGGGRPDEENTIMMHSAPREWVAPDTSQPANATAQFVARLWAEREHGGIVELHIAGGSVILPEWYEPRWSSGSHGLFASQAADGSVTLTAVAWDSIQKIVVRQVEGLPDGMFE